jgi:ATP-dependent exoDNAse (exonuclease V) beta subunit
VRLFYVAHSRAQYSLTILATHAQRDNDGPQLGPGGAAAITTNGGHDLTLLPVRGLPRIRP